LDKRGTCEWKIANEDEIIDSAGGPRYMQFIQTVVDRISQTLPIAV
jgi:hypothetical protein